MSAVKSKAIFSILSKLVDKQLLYREGRVCSPSEKRRSVLSLFVSIGKEFLKKTLPIHEADPLRMSILLKSEEEIDS
jgi:hypothetical protein